MASNTQRFSPCCFQPIPEKPQGSHGLSSEEWLKKSAHTALAVKACLLGGNSNTKCSMTFVNIAVAISALAGGPKNGFAPRPEYGGVFNIFEYFWVSERKRVLKWNFGSFW